MMTDAELRVYLDFGPNEDRRWGEFLANLPAERRVQYDCMADSEAYGRRRAQDRDRAILQWGALACLIVIGALLFL